MAKHTFPGSSYRKVDLHIHTPASHDYRDKTATPEDIVAQALLVELDAIAITDHDNFEFIDSVINAAKGTDLTVFPGVEISTRDGHLLAIFDVHKTGDDVKAVLISAGIGTDGNPFGKPKTFTSKPIEEVASSVPKRF